MIKFVAVLVLGLGMVSLTFESNQNIRYFQTATISLQDTSDIKIELINDSVYQVKTSSGLPLYYYTLLNTGVCFDNKCRPLSIYIYWNITGRYLGFELPDEEFLSKYDHDPFKPFEYQWLDSLLANPYLPLGNYSFYELVNVPSSDSLKVDGVSGATSKDVLEYVVPGAAYTTHKLWNVVHGPLQKRIVALTESQLDASLFNLILKSSVSEDRIWVLESLSGLEDFDNHVMDAIVPIIKGENYFESYLALESIQKSHLNLDSFQLKLFNVIGEVDYQIESLILEKLRSAPYLSKKVIDASLPMLGNLSGTQLIKFLELYKAHNVQDPNLCLELLSLAKSNNPFIRNQINQFLIDSSCD